ncbi:hypothetical protein ACS3UN_06645 [Oscillospiraceae bacterium LTW-04]|nr:hypothetical protein [Eubacteriales bacterium]WMJ84547.1 hypothetical protein RBH76_03715 [Oscillospiraceae bacterium MB24-C1]
MKMLFEKELATQELWITGNFNIPVDYRFNDPNLVYCSAESPNYDLPDSGSPDDSSIFENFLSLTEEHDRESQNANKIRRFISRFSATEKYVDDEYIETGDIRIPALNPDINAILYTKEKHGKWH